MGINLEKIRGYLSSSDANERRQAVVFAVKANLVDLVPEITGIAGSDPDQELRILARKALERLRQATHAAKTDYESVNFELLLQSEDPYARFAGLKKALQQNDEVARPSILAALNKESVAQLKASMVKVLGQFKNEADVEVLSEFLKDTDSRVRANAVEALSTIGGSQANRYIVAMMADNDNRVRTNVVKALKDIGGPNLLGLLQEMARDDRPWMRASAVYAFSKIKSPQSLVALAQIASQDVEEEIKNKAFQILSKEKNAGNPAAAAILQKLEELKSDGSITPPDAGKVQKTQQEIATQFAAPADASLEQQLLNRDPCQRYLAVSVIQKNFDQNRKLFIKAFQDETDPFLISLMLTIIKDRKVSEVVNRCIQLLKHDDDRVRANAVEAAAELEIASSADYIFPLLKDKNSRVAANAVIALGSIGRIDMLEEVQKLLDRDRERFRQSALYIVSLQREQQYVPILEKLLADSSPKVRDKAYDILRIYANDNVSGAAKILQGIEKRISLEQNREHFFENRLDQMFGSLIQMIKSDDETKDKFVFERTPEAEQQALIALAQKSLELKLGDDRIPVMLEQLDTDLAKVEKLLKEVSVPPTGDEPVKESADRMSEIQLLNIEKRSLTARRNALLASFAMDIYSNRHNLDLRSQASLRVELARAEGSLCPHVPKGEFSMLPEKDAPVSEIFDVAMRLYQKHVWSFSIKTCIYGFRFGLYPTLLFLVTFVLFKIHPIFGGLFFLTFVPLLGYKALGLYVEWKILIGCMVDDLIHGRFKEDNDWQPKVNQIYPRVFANSLRKFFVLIAYFIVAMLIGSTVIGGALVYLKGTVLEAIAQLVSLLMIIFIMGSVYFKYNLIEPVSTFFDRGDAFVVADKIYALGRIKVILLIVFSTFIMMLITSYSTQAVQLASPLLGRAGGFLVILLAVLSEICLLPIVYSCVVIYTLMYKHEQDLKIRNRS